MIYIILGLSILLNVVFIVLIANHRQTVNESVEQLKRINLDNSQMKLKNFSTQKEYDDLIEEMNKLIDKHNKTKTHYQRASEQNKKMVSSISHDFRTPLTSMLGYVQLLQNNPSPEKRDYYLSIIEERTKNLNNLVNEFYLLSLLDSDSYQLESENINPTAHVQECLALYYADLNSQFESISVELDEQPLKTQTSSVDFDRIIGNLIRNAVNHGVEFFKIENHITENSVQFFFTNGIDDNNPIDPNKIFDRLYKADLSRTKSSTGLGLAISKELAEKLDYDLDVKIQNKTIQFILEIDL